MDLTDTSKLSGLFRRRGSEYASAVDIDAVQAAAGIAGNYISAEEEENAAEFVKEARRRNISVLSGIMPTEPDSRPTIKPTLDF